MIHIIIKSKKKDQTGGPSETSEWNGGRHRIETWTRECLVEDYENTHEETPLWNKFSYYKTILSLLRLDDFFFNDRFEFYKEKKSEKVENICDEKIWSRLIWKINLKTSNSDIHW